MGSLELKIPPPLVGLAVALLMWLASLAVPGLAWPRAARMILALVTAGLGVGISAAGVRSFARVHTTVNPMKPEGASSLVTTGIFRFTRNPMYVGLLVILIGWAIFLANAASILVLPVFVLYMNRFQIGPEERVLTGIFGADFAAYRSRVRRWL